MVYLYEFIKGTSKQKETLFLHTGYFNVKVSLQITFRIGLALLPGIAPVLITNDFYVWKSLFIDRTLHVSNHCSEHHSNNSAVGLTITYLRNFTSQGTVSPILKLSIAVTEIM